MRIIRCFVVVQVQYVSYEEKKQVVARAYAVQYAFTHRKLHFIDQSRIKHEVSHI